jgi:hypothetical protein
MNKIKVFLSIFITVVLLTVGGCQTETITKTVTVEETTTLKPATTTITVTPTVQTVTVTEVKSITTIATASDTTTSIPTSTSTGTATTTTTNSILSPDGKLQIINPKLNIIYTVLTVSGSVLNLSTETLNAKITAEFSDLNNNTLSTDSIEVKNIDPGENRSFTVNSNAALYGTVHSFVISVEVIS